MQELIKQTELFCKECKDKMTLLCNMSALLNEHLKDINWVGFYLLVNNELHLGPFQGKVACEVIQLDKGVCGAAFSRKMLLNVKNVHEFPGHIACDSASNSELVVPLVYKNKKLGVLDIDSPSFDRFSYEDEEAMAKVADMIATALTR